MTISGRNNFLKAGVSLSALLLFLMGAGAYYSWAFLPDAIARSARRSAGFIDALGLYRFFPPAFQVPLISISVSILYALVSLILIYVYFEKTKAPEILFIAFFAFSLSFESLRIMISLQAAYELPGLFLIFTYRALLFGRYFGIFSLFFAGVLAAGMEIQRYRVIIMIVVSAALVIAMGIPLEGLAWDTAMNMLNGYRSLLQFVEGGIAALTVLSFLVASYSRGIREYLLIGAGILLAFLGRTLLINADAWIIPLPALTFLVLGAWLTGRELHRVYLWL